MRDERERSGETRRAPVAGAGEISTSVGCGACAHGFANRAPGRRRGSARRHYGLLPGAGYGLAGSTGSSRKEERGIPARRAQHSPRSAGFAPCSAVSAAWRGTRLPFWAPGAAGREKRDTESAARRREDAAMARRKARVSLFSAGCLKLPAGGIRTRQQKDWLRFSARHPPRLLSGDEAPAGCAGLTCINSGRAQRARENATLGASPLSRGQNLPSGAHGRAGGRGFHAGLSGCRTARLRGALPRRRPNAPPLLHDASAIARGSERRDASRHKHARARPRSGFAGGRARRGGNTTASPEASSEPHKRPRGRERAHRHAG